MNFQVPEVAFYTLKNKHSENNSDNETSRETGKSWWGMLFLAIESVSEKSNIMYMFYQNTNMNIKYSSEPTGEILIKNHIY